MSKTINADTPDDIMVQNAYDRLIGSYSRSNHRKKLDIIERAFLFAKKAHQGVKRRSGIPYIMHPLAVAQVVSEEMGLGSTSICSALLHDVVEDSNYTVEDIRNAFGDKISQIVDGLTKISSGGNLSEVNSLQAENMRRLLLTMSEDIRVILIKIADRLHNLRTLDAMSQAQQLRTTGETMYLYAPIAHRLGLFAIKSEMEDLCLKYDRPEEYKQIKEKLETTTANREAIYKHFAEPLYPKLDKLEITYRMQERVKSIYSIWNKMQTKNLAFESIYDIFAVRIVFEPKPDVDEKKQCWEIYQAITSSYILRHGRIRDWINQPKPNGYQALHLTVMGPDGQWIEIQIRTTQMDEIDERGFAAHWKYKQNDGQPITEEQGELDKWLKQIQDILEEPSPDAMDFLNNIRMNLFATEIFVFTPKGEIKTLPQGASVLDFAYSIHSNMGEKCIGANVNHRLVPFSYKLASGDQVEVLTSRAQIPHSNWLNFVITAKAKTKIEAILRKQKKEKVKQGEQILNDFLTKFDIEPTIQLMDKLVSFYGYTKRDDFHFALSEKQVVLPENPSKLFKEKSGNSFVSFVKNTLGSSKSSAEIQNPEDNTLDLNHIDKKKTLILREEFFEKNYTAAACCHPIPGEEVLGYINEDNRLEIHKRTCEVALNARAHHANRIISCEWAGHKAKDFPATIELEGIDRMGILNDITKVITNDLQVNVLRLSLETVGGVFKGTIVVSIHDMEDIRNALDKLQKIKDVKSVKRIL
jgi:GTP pyrophosphokinase